MTVEPILVVVNPKKLVIREQPSGLVVVSSKQLIRWLTRLDRRLDGVDVALISDVADRNTTWSAVVESTSDTEQLHRDFATLRESVGTSTTTRVLWAVAAFIVIAAVVWVGVAVFVQHVVMH